MVEGLVRSLVRFKNPVTSLVRLNSIECLPVDLDVDGFWTALCEIVLGDFHDAVESENGCHGYQNIGNRVDPFSRFGPSPHILSTLMQLRAAFLAPIFSAGV